MTERAKRATRAEQQARITAMAAMWAEGAKASEIAARMGIAEKSVESIVYNHRDLFPTRRPALFNGWAVMTVEEKLAAVQPLLGRNLTQTEMAEALGCGRTQLGDFMREQGLTKGKGGNPRSQAKINPRRTAPAPDRAWAEIPPRERVELVAGLWAEGLSTTLIARRLGCTRTAIIGIAARHRERCPMRNRAESAAASKPIKLARPSQPVVLPTTVVPFARPTVEKKPLAVEPPAATVKDDLTVQPADDGAPAALPEETPTQVRFLDRRETQCPRPLWTGKPDAKSIGAAMVCGAPKADSARWCDACRPRMISRGAAPEVSAAWAFSRRGRAA